MEPLHIRVKWLHNVEHVTILRVLVSLLKVGEMNVSMEQFKPEVFPKDMCTRGETHVCGVIHPLLKIRKCFEVVLPERA